MRYLIFSSAPGSLHGDTLSLQLKADFPFLHTPPQLKAGFTFYILRCSLRLALLFYILRRSLSGGQTAGPGEVKVVPAADSIHIYDFTGQIQTIAYF